MTHEDLRKDVEKTLLDSKLPQDVRLAKVYGSVIQYCAIMDTLGAPKFALVDEPKKAAAKRATKKKTEEVKEEVKVEKEVETKEATKEEPEPKRARGKNKTTTKSSNDKKATIPPGTVDCDDCGNTGEKDGKKCDPCDGDGYHEQDDIKDTNLKDLGLEEEERVDVSEVLEEPEPQKRKRRVRKQKVEEPVEEPEIEDNDDEEEETQPRRRRRARRRRG